MNVGAVQSYSAGVTVTHGYFASNSLIWRFSASTASWVAPGRSAPTVMVTGWWPASGSLGAAVAGAVDATAAVDGAATDGAGLLAEDPQADTTITVMAAATAASPATTRASCPT